MPHDRPCAAPPSVGWWHVAPVVAIRAALAPAALLQDEFANQHANEHGEEHADRSAPGVVKPPGRSIADSGSAGV